MQNQFTLEKEEKLKPCPFCGGNSIYEINGFFAPVNNVNNRYECEIYCCDCGAIISTWHLCRDGYSSEKEAKNEAIKLWNKRA